MLFCVAIVFFFGKGKEQVQKTAPPINKDIGKHQSELQVNNDSPDENIIPSSSEANNAPIIDFDAEVDNQSGNVSNVFEDEISAIDKEIESIQSQLEETAWRTWTSTVGTTLHARYRGTNNKKDVTLEKEDGNKITLDISKLSNDDQRWISDSSDERKKLNARISALTRNKKKVLEVQKESEKLAAEESARKAKIKGVTMAGYHAIVTGMSYNQVVEILGEHGEELSRVDIGNILTVMMIWKAPGWSGGNMTLTFQNGVVTVKAQHGLN